MSQHEQGLLIEKELLSRQRAEAEARYRILADNAVDIIVRLRGSDILWISPSVETAFGHPAELWIGSDLKGRIHPDDRDMVIAKLQRINPETGVHARFRVRTGDYHWVRWTRKALRGHRRQHQRRHYGASHRR
jgi:PAS domain S-box-containing protein